MANSDQTRKVLIDLSGAIETLSQKLEEDGEKSALTAAKQEELAKVMEELNKISPGLGEAINLLSVAYQQAGAAAKGGAVNVGSFNTALGSTIRAVGPMALVSLSIQAAMTYWDLYNEKVAKAAQAQAESLDKIRKSTKEALDEQAGFEAAMKKASEPEDKYAESLTHSNTIITAQTEAKRKSLKQDEEAELEQAKTPEEQETVKKSYQQKDEALSSGDEAQKNEALENTITDLKSDQDTAQAERNQRKEWIPKIVLLAEEAKARGDEEREKELLDQIPGFNKKINELDARIADDQTKITRYDRAAKTQAEVHQINDAGRSQGSDRQISAAAEGIDAQSHGEKLSHEQIKANQALTQLFAAHAGGIAQMQAIIKYHLEHSTTQAQEISALKTALAGLQQQTGNIARPL